MPVYAIERSVVERLGLSEHDADRIKGIDDVNGVRWLLSFLDADCKKSCFVYEAPDADARAGATP